MKARRFQLRWFLALIFAVALIGTGSLCAGAAEQQPSEGTQGGTEQQDSSRIQCGENVWGVLSQDGGLVISGAGDMWAYADSGQSVFDGIKEKIRRIVIEDGITSIGDYAFENTACDQIVIGKGVRYIGRRAFRASNNLESVTIPGNVGHIGPGAFRESSKLVYCELSAGLQIIDQYAFYQTPLASVEIPDGVREICKRAFAQTAVTRVTIPTSVTKLGGYVFGKVSALIYSVNAQIEAKAFGSGSSLTIRRNSTAEAYVNTYAKKDSLKITYLECDPPGGVPAVSHSWDGGAVTKKSTCLVQGERTYTCTRCGKTKIEYLGRISHTYGKWQTLTKATVFAEGLMGRSCTVCGYMQTSVLPVVSPVISVNINTLSLGVGETYKLKVIAIGAGDSVASWKSENEKIACVSSSGKVSAKAAGTTTITVSLESGVSANVRVTVRKIPTKKLSVSAKGVRLKKKKVSVKVKKTFTLVPKVNPSNASDQLTFSSSKKSVVTVTKKGKVTARRKGKAKITVKSGKKKVTITVTVK